MQGEPMDFPLDSAMRVASWRPNRLAPRLLLEPGDVSPTGSMTYVAAVSILRRRSPCVAVSCATIMEALRTA